VGGVADGGDMNAPRPGTMAHRRQRARERAPAAARAELDGLVELVRAEDRGHDHPAMAVLTIGERRLAVAARRASPLEPWQPDALHVCVLDAADGTPRRPTQVDLLTIRACIWPDNARVAQDELDDADEPAVDLFGPLPWSL
jgi:hypothetical protein